MNAILLLTIVPFTICVCGALIMFERVSKTDQCLRISSLFFLRIFSTREIIFFYDLQMAFLGFCASFFLLFILFKLGQILHTDLKTLSDTIYETEWYRYPLSIQRSLQLMMMRSQRPFFLSASGIMALNLENFVGVSLRQRIELSFRQLNRSIFPAAEMDLLSFYAVAQF